MSLSLTEKVLKKYLNPVFIETGTGEGGGVQIADGCGFQRIITIDVNEDSLRKAKMRVPSCETIKGDSRTALAEVLRGIKQPVTFFLDAHNHYSGQSPVCCALEEVWAISQWWVKGSCILVDDFRMFGGGTCVGDWAKLVSQSDLLRSFSKLVNHHGCRLWFEDAVNDRQDILACGEGPR